MAEDNSPELEKLAEEQLNDRLWGQSDQPIKTFATREEYEADCRARGIEPAPLPD